ncbi:MAG: arginine--tRNA ligase [Candidatus Bipolaricaulota bacterium]
MFKKEIKRLLFQTLEELDYEIDRDLLRVEEPGNPEHGDFSTNVALELGSDGQGVPRKIAEEIAASVDGEPFDRVAVAGPGFINFEISGSFLRSSLLQLLQEGDPLAGVREPREERIQIEFVSSNPTGPLTVGHCRQAVLGDVLAALYRGLGYDVSTEYYFNDEGGQMKVMAHTLWTRYMQQLGHDVETPEQGYRGDYLIDIAAAVVDEFGEEYTEWNDETEGLFKEIGLTEMVQRIKSDLESLGVKFDNWFSESQLHREKEVEKTLARLRGNDATYEEDGAVWLKAEEEGAPQDVVLVKSDGDPTYLLPDLAYHMDKYGRGFDRALVLLGADHQRHVENMNAGLSKLGLPDDFYQVLINQFVSLSKDGEVRRMSTRKGEFITMKDLIDDLGPDVVRYFMVARKPESHLEFDYDLAKKRSMDNPVYYIQYAYTRIVSIFRKAGLSPDELNLGELKLDKLGKPEELELIKLTDAYPETVEVAAWDYGPHHLASYGEELASTFHTYYNKYRVLTDDGELSDARLGLCKGVQIVLRSLLEILGVSAPQKM